MGDGMNFIMAVILVSTFVIFGAQIFTYGVSHSVNPTTQEYPLINKSNEYQQLSSNYTADLMNLTQSSQQTDPSLSLVSDIINAGTALAKTLTFTGSSAAIAFEMLGDAFSSLEAFGIPAWVMTTIIAAASIFLIYAIISALLRWNA